jgi:hypothetical protein
VGSAVDQAVGTQLCVFVCRIKSGNAQHGPQSHHYQIYAFLKQDQHIYSWHILHNSALSSVYQLIRMYSAEIITTGAFIRKPDASN